jgi:hypothetical protein
LLALVTPCEQVGNAYAVESVQHTQQSGFGIDPQLEVNSSVAKSSLWQQLWQQHAVVRQQWGSADVAFQFAGAKAKFYAIWTSY